MTNRQNPNGRLSAVVLAAGTSTRMGRAKQLLPLGGTTVLACTIEKVRAAGLDEIVLVLGASAEDIQQQLPPSLVASLRIVINRAHGQGMASSLYEGLSHVDPRSCAALIVLGDQPLIDPETIHRIIDGYRGARAQIVIPSYQGNRGNPVLLDRSVFAEVMALKGDIGCRAIFSNHLDAILKVEVEDPGILLDIDSLDDYERSKRLFVRE
jgi:molybdenum cofactor cytidylyltransferase